MSWNSTPAKDKEVEKANIILRDFQDVNLRGGDLELSNGNGSGESGKTAESSPTGSDRSGATISDDSSERMHDQLPSIDDVIMNNLNRKKLFGNGNGRSRFNLVAFIQKRRESVSTKTSYAIVAFSLLVIFVSMIGLAVHLSKTGTSRHFADTYHVQLLTRTGLMISILSGTVSDEYTMSDASTPQRRAINWLATQDDYQIDIPTSLIAEENDNVSADIDAFLQRYAIATVAIALQGDDLDNLSSELGFFSNSHECHWHELFERPNDNTTLRMGITCNDDDQIEKLVLQTLELNGSLPREIGLLTSLTTLRLDANNITSLIPNYMKHCSKLEEVSLSMNNFHGQLSDWMPSSWPALKEFQISYNDMGGQIPDNFGELTNIELFALDNNHFIGNFVQKIQSWSSLVELYLQNNSLQDHLHPHSFDALTSLEVLDISSNKVLGQFPEYIFHLPAIRVVDVADNAITGPISENDSIPETATVHYFDAKSNFLNGIIPHTISNLYNLRHLDLSTNRFTGALPDTMRDLTRLEHLYLEDNGGLAPGPVPHWLRYFTDMKEISLMDTSLTGVMPNAFSYMTNLRVLNLGMNTLNSTIPTTLGELTELRFLLLNRNAFYGEVPTEIGNLINLELLVLDHNELTGTVGNEICAIPAIDIMVADCSDASGECTDCYNPKVECPCCTECCTYGEVGCSAGNYLEDTFSGEWGDAYVRTGHVFTPTSEDDKETFLFVPAP